MLQLFAVISLLFITRNTLDCDQSNLYSPRVVSSAISQDLLFRSFSVYRRSAIVTLLCEKVSNLRHYRLESEGKVWSAYSESDNALLRYGHLKFSKMAACRHLEFDLTGNVAVRSAVPETPPQNQR